PRSAVPGRGVDTAIRAAVRYDDAAVRPRGDRRRVLRRLAADDLRARPAVPVVDRGAIAEAEILGPDHKDAAVGGDSDLDEDAEGAIIPRDCFGVVKRAIRPDPAHVDLFLVLIDPGDIYGPIGAGR